MEKSCTKRGWWLLLVGLLVPGLAWAANPTLNAQKPGAVEVRLVSEKVAIQPGRPFWLGIMMKHDAHWHTYWRNPGDAGMPTTLAWRLPPRFQAGEIEWPYPARLQQGPLASYGYEGQMLLPVLVFPPRDLAAGQKLTFDVTVRWLECNENCVPRQAELSLSRPVATGPAEAGPEQALFAEARANLPQKLEGMKAEAVRRGNVLEVRLNLPEGMGRKGQLFMEQEDVVEPGFVPAVAESGKTVLWTSQLTYRGRNLPAGNLSAVWVAAAAPTKGLPRALRLDVELKP